MKVGFWVALVLFAVAFTVGFWLAVLMLEGLRDGVALLVDGWSR